MLPQKNYDKLERDIEEIKLTLNSITNNMSNLKELTEEIKGLKKLLSKKEKITTQLQQRVDDLEQYSRKDVIISGLETRYHSYAIMANPSEAVGEDAPSEELQTLEDQVTNFFQQVVPADVQQQVKEESPEEWSPGVDQQDSEPPHIKEEMRTSWEEEQQEAKEETDDLKSSFTESPLKSEDDEEKPLFSQVHQHPMVDGDFPPSSSADQMMAAAAGVETSRNPDLITHDDGSSFAETKVSEDDEEKLLFSQPHQHLMVDGDLPTSSSADQMMAAAAGVETSRNPDLNIHDDDSSSSEMDVSEDDKDGSSSVRESKNEDSELKRETPVSGVTVINKSFSCSECGRQFVNLRLLQKYPTCSLRIICSNCLVKNKHFKRKTLVGSCRTVQTIQKSFICEDCGKIFTKKEYLNRHRRIHTGHKPFACDVCGQRFNDQSNCRSHMKIHSKQKLYVCNACGQRFSQKSHLNAHMRIHTGQKPFVCDVCGQRFSNKSNFRSHKRIHT